MAWQVSKRVWDNAQNIKLNYKVMLLALADKADESGVCWPKYDTSYETLGAMVGGLDRRSAMRLIDNLVEAGHILKIKTVGRGHSNTFVVTSGLSKDEILATLTKNNLDTSGLNGDNPVTIIKEEGEEDQPEMVTTLTQNGDNPVTNSGLNGDNPVTQPYLINPPLPTISPNGDSGKKPQSDSKKWGKANKKIVGDKFFELTKLPLPDEKTLGFWYGSLYEIFKMSNKDPTETCRIMGLVVKYMQDNHLTISSPKSLHWGVRALVSGQELSKAKYGRKPFRQDQKPSGAGQSKSTGLDPANPGPVSREEWDRMLRST